MDSVFGKMGNLNAKTNLHTVVTHIHRLRELSLL